LHADGIGELEDYMPVGGEQLIRRVRVVRGRMAFRLECRPAFDYARARHDVAFDECGAVFRGPGLTLGLSSQVLLHPADGGVTADFTLDEGRSAVFVLSIQPPGHHSEACPTAYQAEQQFRQTVDYWHRWLRRCTYHGRWREIVQRSALALKLL